MLQHAWEGRSGSRLHVPLQEQAGQARAEQPYSGMKLQKQLTNPCHLENGVYWKICGDAGVGSNHSTFFGQEGGQGNPF